MNKYKRGKKWQIEYIINHSDVWWVVHLFIGRHMELLCRRMALRSVLLRFILTTFVIFPSGMLTGQQRDMRFERLNSKDGLSQISVECILQDKLGFMWFGTADGLNRYDGYQFKVFRNRPGDASSISDNDILSIVEDKASFLWIGTSGGGLNRYNPMRNTFYSWRNDPSDPTSLASNRVDSLLFDEDGVLWIGTSNGLSRLNPDSNAFVNYRNDPQNHKSLAGNHVNAIYQDRSGILWVGSNKGSLQRMEIDGSFSTFTPFPQSESSSKDILTIFETSDDKLWVGTSQGAVIFNRESETFEYFSSNKQSTNSLSDRWVECILEDSQGRIWVGTGDGLNRLQENGEYFDRIYHDPARPNSLSHNTVSHLYQDRSDVLWIATTGGGLNKYHHRKEIFNHIERSPQTGLSLNSIWCFLKDQEDNLWIGTWGGGLNLLRKGQKNFQQFRHDPDNRKSLSHDDVRCLFQDSRGNVWIGTTNRLNSFNPSTQSFTHYGEAAGLSDNQVYTIVEDHLHRLWIGTGRGLNVFNYETGTFSHYFHNPDQPGTLSHDRIRMVFEDSQKKLWIATSMGLNLFNEEGEFEHYRHNPQKPQSLSHDEVRAIIEDGKGRLWVGTSNGLNLFHPEQGIFEAFQQGDGLPNNVIYGILEDEIGFLWISTNQGLSRMDPDRKSFLNYDFQDGLQDNEFNQAAAYKDRNGALYFGGNKGYNFFHASKIQPYSAPQRPVITDFTISNNSVALRNANPSSPLLFTPPYTQSLTLNPDHKTFGFEFASLHFLNSEKSRYAFRLKGFEEEWNYTDNSRNYASYTHLSHGQYIFQVRSTNKEGVWSKEIRSVNILIKPPWRKTWWFYLICTLSLILIIRHYALAHHRKLEKERTLNERINRQLEKSVAERTRELKLKNHALDARYRELETLDRIVQIINRELTMEDVVQAILEQGLVLIPQAEVCVFLLRNATRETYECIAQAGSIEVDPGNLIFTNTEQLDLLGSKMAWVDKGVYIVSSLPEQVRPHILDASLPQAMASLSIDHEQQIVGILLLASYENGHAFEEVDPKILSRLREHAISAVTKAQALQDLVQAQKDLVDAAHYAGMAEVAVNVLHDMGNTLNSVQTSVHVLDHLFKNRPLHRLLGKSLELLENAQEKGTEQREVWDDSILQSLKVIHSRWEAQQKTMQAEIERIDGHTRRMVATLQEQQTYSKMGNTLEMLDLNTIVRNTLALQAPMIKKANIETTLSLEPLPPVQLSKSRLMYCIGYILKNACEAIMAGNSEEKHILLRTTISNDQAQLKISDTGTGIKPEYLKSLFVNGFTTKTGSRGHGLHYCANAVKEMKGSITLQSDGPGQGAHVTLTFPIARK